MLKTLLFISIIISTINANGQTEYQTNYYDLVKQVRDVTKKAFLPLNNPKPKLRLEIFEIVKLTHRLQEEALTEALENEKGAALLRDIGFGCKICDVLLEAIDLKISTNSKIYDSYIEKLKALELTITLKIKTQEKLELIGN